MLSCPFDVSSKLISMTILTSMDRSWNTKYFILYTYTHGDLIKNIHQTFIPYKLYYNIICNAQNLIHIS